MDRNQVATSPGMGWRLKSESGGGMNQNRVAICVGIRKRRKALLKKRKNGSQIIIQQENFVVEIYFFKITKNPLKSSRP